MDSLQTVTPVPGVALVFEGGGMRASYTSGMVNTLIEAGLAFPFVGGISAGSSNAVNYLLGDTWRTRVSFTDLVLDPRFGGLKTFLRGRGFFNAEWTLPPGLPARQRHSLRLCPLSGQPYRAGYPGFRPRHGGVGRLAP